MPIISAGTRESRSFDGVRYGATISVIVDDSAPGEGPRLHSHPYDETWVVHEGRLAFRLGDAQHLVGPGDIVIAPAGVPHKFTNEGTGPSKSVCIHASPEKITTWLE